MKKILILGFLSLLFLYPWEKTLAGEQTDNFITASFAVDTSGTSPQYLSGADLSPIHNVDDSTLTTSLLPTSINTDSPSFVFRYSSSYTPPGDEEIKSLSVKMVYKTNVGTLNQHYIQVKYLNSSNQRITCLNQHILSIPSASGSYVTDEFDISNCREGNGLSTVEVYYFAAALLQPVNTSFDQVVLLVKHGNKTSNSTSDSTTSTKSNFIKSIDVSRNGGYFSRENGWVNILFQKNSLPYEIQLITEKIFSPQVVKPSYLSGYIYKISIFASFNGYPLVKFNPSLIFIDYQNCWSKPIITMSQDGKRWKNLHTVKTLNPANRLAAVVNSPGYYAISCLP